MTCGACCAMYRVSFPGSESSDRPGGIVPVGLTVSIGRDRCAMRGTEGAAKRCIALVGKVGSDVCCSIYDNRPSGCRILAASWQPDRDSFACDRARASYGMVPFGGY